MKKYVALVILLLSFQSSAFSMEPDVRDEVQNFSSQKRINEIVCATAENVYKKINMNWTYVLPHEKMKVDSPFWEACWIGMEGFGLDVTEESNAPTLILKTSPDRLIEALEDLIHKPAALECTIAQTAVKIFCMKEILGEKYFNEYAAQFADALTKTEGWAPHQFFHELPMQFIDGVVGKAVPGSFSHIPNIPQYNYYKSNGNGQGSNVVCVANDQYLGFSAIYKNEPESLKAIEKQDLEMFFKLDDVERDHNAHKLFCFWLLANEGAFEKIRAKGQEKNYNFHFIFNGQAFIDYKNTGFINL